MGHWKQHQGGDQGEWKLLTGRYQEGGRGQKRPFCGFLFWFLASILQFTLLPPKLQLMNDIPHINLVILDQDNSVYLKYL